jgi:Ca2+-binding RTX toxin-like protein
VGAIAIAATTLSALILAHPTLASAGTPTCHGESATIVGTSGADNLHGTSGHDVIVGRGGNDVIDGRGGNDTI